MHSKFNQYGSPAIKLAEECSELAIACLKIERFGLDDWNPLDPLLISNREKILCEILDVQKRIDEIIGWIKSIPIGSHRIRQGDDASYRD